MIPNHQNAHSSAMNAEALGDNRNGDGLQGIAIPEDAQQLDTDAAGDLPQFQLVSVQEPRLGRMMGTAKTARFISPPLIIEAIAINRPNGLCESDWARTLICKLLLVKESGAPPRTQLLEERASDSLAYINNEDVVGNPISPCYHLLDFEGRRGLYFIWPELSVRFVGKVYHPTSIAC